jgi:hypothetical protein
MPLVITLSACYSDAAGYQDGTSFAGRLCRHGAAAVIATESSITDSYATRLLARVYGSLAQNGELDVVSALADARRQLQAELETSPVPRDALLAELCEWAAVTVLAATESVPARGVGPTEPSARQAVRPQIVGLTRRADWYFVGHRIEQRHWPTELTGPGTSGIVICGIGGVGKTALADQLVARIRESEPGRVLVTLAGPLTLESQLDAVITGIRRDLLVSGARDTEDAIRALGVAARADRSWQERLTLLRDHVLKTTCAPKALITWCGMRCWESCWPPGQLIRARAGSWSLAGIRSPCPEARRGTCRSGSWDRCRTRRQ